MTTEADLDHNHLVQQHFHAESFFWKDVYTQDSLNGALYRERRAGVLRFVDGLNLPPNARALDVGCGAGATSVALARRGLRVEAVDAVPDMLNLTEQEASASGMQDRIGVRHADVHRLPFRAGTFDLAVAIGVMEWMSCYAAPLAELHRVLRPGGWLIVNVDNARALHCLLDPRMNPLSRPLKRSLRRIAESAGCIPRVARPSRCSRTGLNHALRDARFDIAASRTCGFGPLTLLGLPVVPDRTAVRLHQYLQRAADRRLPLIRNGGDTYLVLAHKPATEQPVGQD